MCDCTIAAGRRDVGKGREGALLERNRQEDEGSTPAGALCVLDSGGNRNPLK